MKIRIALPVIITYMDDEDIWNNHTYSMPASSM